jgi:hypothetical protein
LRNSAVWWDVFHRLPNQAIEIITHGPWFRQAAVIQKTCSQTPASLASSSFVGHKPEIRNHGK